MRSRLGSTFLISATIFVVGCGAGTSPTASPTTQTQLPTTAPPPTQPDSSGSGSGAAIEGLFDVGGHKLYLKCTGDGSPTVLYFHGSIVNKGDQPVDNAEQMRRRLDGDYRFCAYDRRNVGKSETVDEPQEPDDVMADLETLLAVAQVEGPFVPLAASFGGVPAYLFANRHPDDIVGMVMLDTMFPDELSLDHLWPDDQSYSYYGPIDESSSLERISHHKMLQAATEYIGHEPDVPLIYFASEQEPINESGPPEYNAAVLDVLQGYIDRFSPGRLEWVDSPHFMEVAIPGKAADAVHDVIELANQ